MTPFGSPVLPLEKITVARSIQDLRFHFGCDWQTKSRSSRRTGKKYAMKNAASFSARTPAPACCRAASDSSKIKQFARHCEFHFFQKRPRGDDGFDSALLGCTRRARLPKACNSGSPAPCRRASRRDSPARRARYGGRSSPTFSCPAPDSAFQPSRQKNGFHQRRAKGDFLATARRPWRSGTDAAAPSARNARVQRLHARPAIIATHPRAIPARPRALRTRSRAAASARRNSP